MLQNLIAAIDRLGCYGLEPVMSDLDFVQKMSFGVAVLDSLDEKIEILEEKFREEGERILRCEEAEARFDRRDYKLLKRLHYEKTVQSEKNEQIDALNEYADAISDLLFNVENQAVRDLGYLPHSFFDD